MWESAVAIDQRNIGEPAHLSKTEAIHLWGREREPALLC